jgi:hypothetical protein
MVVMSRLPQSGNMNIGDRTRRGARAADRKLPSWPHAQESSWREDNRRVSNGDQVNRIAGLALKRGKSVDFTGYWLWS